MVADIPRQDEKRLDEARDGGPGDRVFRLVALDGAVLADDADILNRDMPSTERHEPKEQEAWPGLEEGEGAGDRGIERDLGGDHPVRRGNERGANEAPDDPEHPGDKEGPAQQQYREPKPRLGK